MTNTNRVNLHPTPFSIEYKSWGRLVVRHTLNFNDNETVRLEVLEGDDKGSTFCIAKDAMMKAIAS